MFLANINGVTAHATALVGYRISGSSFNVWLMDPAIGKTVLSGVYSNGLRYSNNSNTYNWIDTFRLYYR